MPRPSAFPKDDNGSYVTLSLLKNMPNGELVQVYWVKTDIMELIIWKKVEETKSLQSFRVLQRKTDFLLFYGAFEDVAAFWGQNGTTHEINS